MVTLWDDKDEDMLALMLAVFLSCGLGTKIFRSKCSPFPRSASHCFTAKTDSSFFFFFIPQSYKYRDDWNDKNEATR